MKTLIFHLFLLVPYGIIAQNCNSPQLLENKEFKQHIFSKNIQLLDVRTKAEYASGHIEGAVLADIMNKSLFLETIKTLDKNRPVYIYCRSGSRSKSASKLLCDSGFNQIYDLKGGYLTWL
jgi:rhodanese-related sulfurtransferase